jgi:hypothetical protein
MWHLRSLRRAVMHMQGYESGEQAEVSFYLQTRHGSPRSHGNEGF